MNRLQELSLYQAMKLKKQDEKIDRLETALKIARTELERERKANQAMKQQLKELK